MVNSLLEWYFIYLDDKVRRTNKKNKNNFIRWMALVKIITIKMAVKKHNINHKRSFTFKSEREK